MWSAFLDAGRTFLVEAYGAAVDELDHLLVVFGEEPFPVSALRSAGGVVDLESRVVVVRS